jgi:hypothetical protein
MKPWLAFLMLCPLAAQDTTTPAPPAPAAQDTTTPAAPAAPTTPVATSSENTISGSIDVGYQWRSGVGGSLDTYRTVVNLGSGVRLMGLDLSFESAARRWFDHINVRASNWGGDPYNTAHVDVSRHDWYNFSFDYRNIAYFNFLPSYADPTIGQGIYLDQRSFDTHRRMSDFELELMPGKWIVPYVAYSRDSGFGSGITDFVSDSNEYPVADRPRDKTDNYRGGVRIELRKFHVTLEQGATQFKDDQDVYTSNTNLGNRTTPFFGEQLSLTNLAQTYGIQGDSIYSKVLVTADPFSWISVFGQFLYSQPETTVHYSQFNTGQFVNLATVLLFTSEYDLVNAAAKQPHTSGTFGFELRPFKRLRVIESWMTDRLHDASSAALTQQILTPAMAAQLSDFTGQLVGNYSREQVDVLFDVTSKITARGGYRYEWGDALTQGALLSGLPTESGQLRRQVGLAGVSYRTGQKLSFNIDFEGASGDSAYFRTSLQDYERARLRARYQALKTLVVSATFSVLNNQNPNPAVNYDFLSHDASVSFVWTPRDGKRISLSGEYTRATLRSDINYIVPQTFQMAPSSYRDNAHEANAAMNLLVPGFGAYSPRLSLGGSLFISSGSRPTEYYQPLIRLITPTRKHLAWYGEWRYYGFGEPLYYYEGFRTHMLSVGLRCTP